MRCFSSGYFNFCSGASSPTSISRKSQKRVLNIALSDTVRDCVAGMQEIKSVWVPSDAWLRIQRGLLHAMFEQVKISSCSSGKRTVFALNQGSVRCVCRVRAP